MAVLWVCVTAPESETVRNDSQSRWRAPNLAFKVCHITLAFTIIFFLPGLEPREGPLGSQRSVFSHPRCGLDILDAPEACQSAGAAYLRQTSSSQTPPQQKDVVAPPLRLCCVSSRPSNKQIPERLRQ